MVESLVAVGVPAEPQEQLLPQLQPYWGQSCSGQTVVSSWQELVGLTP